jgi:hypothetical protein
MFPYLFRAHSLALGAFVCCSLGIAGCSKKAVPAEPLPAQVKAARPNDPAPAQSAALSQELNKLREMIGDAIHRAAEEIRLQAKTEERRQQASAWERTSGQRLDAIVSAQQAPEATLQALWVWCAKMERYFAQGGAGQSMFAESQPLALDAGVRSARASRQVASRFFPPAKLQEMEKAVATEAAARPWKELGGPDPSKGVLAKGLDLAWAPAEMVGEVGGVGVGVVSSVASTADIPGAISDLVRTVDEMPKEIFENLDNTISTAFGLKQINTAIDSFERISFSTERFAGVAETLPEDVSMVIHKAIEDGVAAQPEIVEVLQESQKLAGSFEAISKDASGMTAEVTEIVIETQELTKELTILVQTVDPLARELLKEPKNPPPAPTEPPRPFNILEYRDTVESLTGTVRELKNTLTEVKAILESPALGPGLRETLGEVNKVANGAQENVEKLIDYVVWRVGALLILFFGLLFAYRAGTSRFRRPAVG